MTAPTFLNPPVHFTRDGFRDYVDGLEFGDWRPQMPYLHNTGVPSLAQWRAMGATPQERWGASLTHYYKGLGWHAGPHAVACPDYIWALCDFTKPGVAQSCSNNRAFAIEMVGNYEVGGDDLDIGDGTKVRDNAAFAIAVMARKVMWTDLSIYEFNTRGLHFHRDCLQDHHACPGSKVKKPDMLTRIASFRNQLGDHLTATAAASEVGSLSWVQSSLNSLGGGGPSGGPLVVDGVSGLETRFAVRKFQRMHGLVVDGDAGPLTCAELSKAVAAAAKST